jgi:hypothetical protein
VLPNSLVRSLCRGLWHKHLVEARDSSSYLDELVCLAQPIFGL